MKVINFFGGPGCGKSTLSSGLFYKLKTQHSKCELVQEYAKDATYEKRFNVLGNQTYIFGKQHHRLFRLCDDVDIAITDSPILLSIIYAKNPTKTFIDFCLERHNTDFENLNFFIKRNKEYQKYGRSQTEDEAKQLDDKILEMLSKYDIKYKTITSDTNIDYLYLDIKKEINLG